MQICILDSIKESNEYIDNYVNALWGSSEEGFKVSALGIVAESCFNMSNPKGLN